MWAVGAQDRAAFLKTVERGKIDGIDLSINQGHLAELTVNDPTRDPVCVAGMLR